MVIVEGPDGGGKTTLVTRLVEELGVQVMPRACTSDNGPIAELWQWVDSDMARPAHDRGLYDRHPLISEPIYGPLIRGYLPERFSDVEWLSNRLSMLRLKRPLIIFCLPPWPVVDLNVRSGHQPTTEHLRGVLQTSRQLYDLYVHRAAIAAGDGLTWVWDYTQDTGKSWLDLVELAREVL